MKPSSGPVPLSPPWLLSSGVSAPVWRHCLAAVSFNKGNRHGRDHLKLVLDSHVCLANITISLPIFCCSVKNAHHSFPESKHEFSHLVWRTVQNSKTSCLQWYQTQESYKSVYLRSSNRTMFCCFPHKWLKQLRIDANFWVLSVNSRPSVGFVVSRPAGEEKIKQSKRPWQLCDAAGASGGYKVSPPVRALSGLGQLRQQPAPSGRSAVSLWQRVQERMWGW